ncbi:hypothetical protein NQ314_008192 [Rhamnusium bicolor]|uniref:Uncharacterized protein n=1 Tax=Rhamnusium bicolor TaxID=1586634 RepID=A0AAV8YG25_9CUCU|nr:hypothetical protein NQ314_008192 [Rhamnusium bicolor]
MLSKFQNKKICSIQEFAQLVGTLVSACLAVKHGWVYTKKLERTKYLALKRSRGDYNKIVYSKMYSRRSEIVAKNVKCSRNPIHR